MTVRVIDIQGGAAGAGGLTFSDSLLSPDQPFTAGDLWLPVFLDNDATTTALSLQGGVNRTATGLQFLNNTGAGFIPRGLFVPYAYNLGAIRTKRQFVEFKIISNPAGLISRPGGFCYCDPNLGSRYDMLMVTEVAQLAVNRINAGVATPIIVQGAPTAYVNNDVVRMTTDAVTTPGTTIINLFKNGTLIASANDNAGARLTNGVVGLGFQGANPAVSTIIANYNGGLLR
jgi:hypothetical protein